MVDKSKAFTLIFEGDIRRFKLNPLTTETPFGIAYAAGVGDAFEEADELREEVERLSKEAGRRG